MKLIFQDRFGDERIVEPDITPDKAGAAIAKFINSINPNYKIYYTRITGPMEDGSYEYDVGSHSEFFYLRP